MTAKRATLVSLTVLTMLSAGCGEFTREGRSPAIIQVLSLTAGEDESGTLLSDVVRLVTSPPCSVTAPCETVFNDNATVALSLILKDPGVPGVAAEPSALNSVTINRYRVQFRRTDGRNVQGVDVPYSFDSAVTFTIPADGQVEAGFELVRHSAKQEAPLRALRSNGSIISTIADVTFYGRDQAGKEISASASLGVDFGNFADPD